MKQFSYTIQGEHGLHARCAGKLVQKAQNFTSNISIEYNQRIENLKRLFTITCLGISKGDFVTVKVEGNDETEAANVLENYFKENLSRQKARLIQSCFLICLHKKIETSITCSDWS